MEGEGREAPEAPRSDDRGGQGGVHGADEQDLPEDLRLRWLDTTSGRSRACACASPSFVNASLLRTRCTSYRPGSGSRGLFVVTAGKAPPYGYLDAGRVLITLEGGALDSEPLAGLVWSKERGKKFIHSVSGRPKRAAAGARTPARRGVPAPRHADGRLQRPVQPRGPGVRASDRREDRQRRVNVRHIVTQMAPTGSAC